MHDLLRTAFIGHLAAFEEEGWPACLDDPLPGGDQVDAHKRLLNAVQRLNGDQVTHLLRFHANVFAGLFTVIMIGLLVENVIFRTIEQRTVRRWGMQN